MAVTMIVMAPTMEELASVPVSAAVALPGNVTIAPKTKRKPAMEELGTYFPIFGKSLKIRSLP